MMKSRFLLGFIYFFQAVTLKADDVCDPGDGDGKTCGRLVISIVGAGDVLPKNKHSIVGAGDLPNKHVVESKHSLEAGLHLMQFTAGNDGILPSKHIVVTSDPELKSSVKQ